MTPLPTALRTFRFFFSRLPWTRPLLVATVQDPPPLSGCFTLPSLPEICKTELFFCVMPLLGPPRFWKVLFLPLRGTTAATEMKLARRKNKKGPDPSTSPPPLTPHLFFHFRVISCESAWNRKIHHRPPPYIEASLTDNLHPRPCPFARVSFFKTLFFFRISFRSVSFFSEPPRCSPSEYLHLSLSLFLCFPYLEFFRLPPIFKKGLSAGGKRFNVIFSCGGFTLWLHQPLASRLKAPAATPFLTRPGPPFKKNVSNTSTRSIL